MKKLKLPVWSDIVYFVLVFIGPAVITSLELFQSKSTIFKWSFASIGCILITFTILKKFVLKNYVTKMEQKVILLEHDYDIDNGNKKKIFTLWKKYKLTLTAISLVTVFLSAILAWLFISALANGLIQFKGAISIICIFLILGITFKISHLILLGGNNEH